MENRPILGNDPRQLLNVGLVGLEALEQGRVVGTTGELLHILVCAKEEAVGEAEIDGAREMRDGLVGVVFAGEATRCGQLDLRLPHALTIALGIRGQRFELGHAHLARFLSEHDREQPIGPVALECPG